MSTTSDKSAAIYVRLSRLHSDDSASKGRSLSEQETETRAKADRLGLAEQSAAFVIQRWLDGDAPPWADGWISRADLYAAYVAEMDTANEYLGETRAEVEAARDRASMQRLDADRRRYQLDIATNASPRCRSSLTSTSTDSPARRPNARGPRP